MDLNSMLVGLIIFFTGQASVVAYWELMSRRGDEE